MDRTGYLRFDAVEGRRLGLIDEVERAKAAKRPFTRAGTYAKRLSLYLEVRNLFDTTYVASAQNLANSISGTTGLQNGAAVLATTTGSIYAGAPRSFVGGMKLSF